MTQTIFTMQFVGAKFAHIPGANTFRKGVRYSALQPGHRVAATNEKEETIGLLTVRSVHVLRFQDALNRYALANHAVAEHDEHGEGRAFLRGVLRSCYGDSRPDDIFTVVEFEAA